MTVGNCYKIINKHHIMYKKKLANV